MKKLLHRVGIILTLIIFLIVYPVFEFSREIWRAIKNFNWWPTTVGTVKDMLGSAIQVFRRGRLF